MKLRISEMLDGYTERDIALGGEKPDVQRITRLTMEKAGAGVSPRRITRRGLTIALAACLVLLLAGAGFAAYLESIREKPVPEGEVITRTFVNYDPSGEAIPGTEFTSFHVMTDAYIEIDAGDMPYFQVCFKPGWLPDEPDANGVVSYASMLRSPPGGAVSDEKYESFLAASGLTEAEAEEYYSTVWHSTDEEIYRIDHIEGLSLSQAKGVFFDGTMVVEEEKTINGMEAMLLSVDYSGPYFHAGSGYKSIVLYDPVNTFLIHIGAKGYDFDTLEKIAENLDVRVTGVKAWDYSLGTPQEWLVLSVGVG